MNPTSKQARTFASLLTAGALLAVPAAGQADKSGDAAKRQGKADQRAATCAQARSAGFSAKGTLVKFTADDPATPSVNEATVTVTLTSANRHARKSGDIVDQDAAKRGVQVKGAEFTIPASDAFALRLKGYEGTDTPSAGDKVKVKGRIALTRKKCAPAGTSRADRYGATDVRRVSISDRDPDA